MLRVIASHKQASVSSVPKLGQRHGSLTDSTEHAYLMAFDHGSLLALRIGLSALLAM